MNADERRIGVNLRKSASYSPLVVSREQRLRRLSSHDSRLSIFRGVNMFLRHTTANENVSCEQRLRRLSTHGSLLSIFRGVLMKLRFTTES